MGREKMKVSAVSSLGELQKLLDARASEEEFKVRVKGLRAICDATPMSEILRHQEAARKWMLSGMDGLEALVVLDGMIGNASQLLNQAIGYMEVIVASAAGSTTPTDADAGSDADAEILVPVFPSANRHAMEVIVHSADGSTSTNDADAETVIPAFPSTRRLSSEDTASMNLAQVMIEAGLGLCGGPLVPCAALLDLATRTLGDEGPSGIIDLSADTVKDGPFDADKPAPVVWGLGAKDNSPTSKLAPAARCLGAKGAIESAVAADMLIPNAPQAEDTFITFGGEDDYIDTDDEATHALAERMIETGTGRRGVPGPAIRHLAKRVLAADVLTTFDITRDDVVGHAPATDLPSLDHFSTMELAERMLEVGTGRRGPPCVPSPSILQLARHVVAGDSPPRDLGDRARHLFTRLMDSGTALRNHRLGSSVTQRAVQGLGARIEDLAVAVMTSRHPHAMLLQFMHTVRLSLTLVHESAVSPQEFDRM